MTHLLTAISAPKSRLIKQLFALCFLFALNGLEVFSQQPTHMKGYSLGDNLLLEGVETSAVVLRNLENDRNLTGFQLCPDCEWREMEHRSDILEIDGLKPAEVYRMSMAWEYPSGGKDTTFFLPVITRSTSSGDILVYFNSSVETEFSNGASPVSTSGTILRNTIIDKIDEAETTIDVAAYNNNRPEIVQALNNAANRGVRVRYIAEGENANTALNTSLAFQVLKRDDDEGIMHHKFLVIDVDDAEKCWVLMGSTNLTTQQLATDNNNMLFIQDQSLAVVYEMEFEEMWGSNTAFPNPGQSRFGENKRDNTPHWLMVGEIPVESYFSPSDNTAFHISNALLEAEESISMALLLFTHNPTAETVIQKHHQGLNVRGLINDIDANGTRYPKLRSNSVNVHSNGVSGVQLHHKYAIIDADAEASQPKVITGSHNWTNRAQNHNDENTLIIHSTDIANIFRQEFEARWCESVPAECLVAALEYGEQSTQYYSLFPNPSSGRFHLKSTSIDEIFQGSLLVFDSNGRPLKALKTQGGNLDLNLSAFPDGQYFIHLQSEAGFQVLPLIIAR